MSYSYDSLEQLLEQAAYRLPLTLLGRLLRQAEDIITVNADSAALEREIFKTLHEHKTGSGLFCLKRLETDGAFA